MTMKKYTMSKGCKGCVFYVEDVVKDGGFCGISEAWLGVEDWRCTYRRTYLLMNGDVKMIEEGDDGGER